jgi:PhoPQ-activated pathogenicity-related protein
MKRLLAAFCVALTICGSSARAENAPSLRTPENGVPDGLYRFVARPEPDYRWKLEETKKLDGATIQRLELVSQKWQDIVWKHALIVYEPPKIEHPRHMLLFVTGGKIGGIPNDGDLLMGTRLAHLTGCRVATLHQVPNQPLLGNKVEDDLITETWLRYLETGDESWPLLFPMVKSAVKAMDALQEFGQSKGYEPIEGFIITGASKRGWTSWLTPVADRRVIATAPIVIDVLNFRAQMKYQMDSWGKYSEQIDDYTRKGLIKILEDSDNPREAKLRTMMDPYTYRNQLPLPKLIIVGTNDRYWTVDAMTRYYDDLIGSKNVLECPNVGHNLGDRKDYALTSLAAFVRHQAAGRAMPRVEWKWSNGGSELKLAVTSDQQPLSAKVWSATSETADFRESKWTSRDLELDGSKCTAVTPKPVGSHIATYVELEFDTGGLKYSLTTQAFRE